MMTLRTWQTLLKPEDQLIVQASLIDGSDGETDCSIGMGHSYCLVQGHPERTQWGSHRVPVLCAIAEGTDARRRTNGRKEYLHTLEQHGIRNLALSPRVYFWSLPECQFVISPEGNGIDCHRHYEALMAGCIPIVEDHPLIRNKYGNVPIVYTHDYSEITFEYLSERYRDMLDRTYDFSRLFLSTWPKEVQEQIKKRGNYWCARLEGRAYYS